MTLDRRTILALSACALASGVAPLRRALAGEISSLWLVEPVGKPSVIWTTLDLIRPALQRQLSGDVEIETVRGRYGFDAIDRILTAEPGKPKLLCTAVMGAQYAAKIVQGGTPLESLTPIVKLTNGFSVTLFAKRGGPLKSWADLATMKPLKVSSLQRPTSTFLAELMVERKGGLATEVTMHEAIPEVVDDVIGGRSSVGIVNTIFLAKQLDRLQPIVSFGAARNAMLGETPTFAEVTGNPKLAFTESVGVYASPKMDTAVAASLTKAFMAVGQDQDVIDHAEAFNLPLAVNGPEVLVETMKRNEGVLERILG